VVAPPTSTTRTAPSSCAARTAASRETPDSTASGVTVLTRRRKRGPLDKPLPPITCARNTSRIAARAGPGASSPTSGSTLSVATTVRSRSNDSASGRAELLPANTIGTVTRARASASALCSNTFSSPPSVPPTNNTTSGRDARSARTSTGPADTCTTFAPADSATRYPASALTNRSCPTTASRRPPPADEHASTVASVADSAAVTEPMPRNTSGGVVSCWAAPSSVPSAPTSAPFVHVEPTSRHRKVTACPTANAAGRKRSR